MEPYPTGARDSFIITLIIAIVVMVIFLKKTSDKSKRPIRTQIWEWLGENTLTQGSLLLVTFIALWITIRVIGFNIRRFLFEEEYNYGAFQVLDIIAISLTISLCLTLLRASAGEVKEIISAAFQSALIVLIIFLPRAVSIDTIRLFGIHGAAFLIIGLAALLASLGYLRKHYVEERE